MATMHIKNKYEVSLNELIDATKKKGGIPKHVDVSPQEAWDILREIALFGKSSPFVIGGQYQLASSVFEIKSRLLNKKEAIELEEAKELVSKWMRGEFTVYFNDLPIHVKWETPNIPTPAGPVREKLEKATWWKFWS